MNSKLEARPVSKQQEQINTMNEKIEKLLREAEEAGIRGDVDQAQSLMQMSDQLKEEKDELIKQHESNGWSVTAEYAASQEKQMEVCQVCGAFLIVGDAQQRIDDHLTGKQHLGYSKLRKAVEEMMEARKRPSPQPEERRRDDRRRERRRDDRRSRDREDRFKRDDRRRDRRDHRDRNYERHERRDRDRDYDRQHKRTDRHRSRSRSH